MTVFLEALHTSGEYHTFTVLLLYVYGILISILGYFGYFSGRGCRQDGWSQY